MSLNRFEYTTALNSRELWFSYREQSSPILFGMCLFTFISNRHKDRPTRWFMKKKIARVAFEFRFVCSFLFFLASKKLEGSMRKTESLTIILQSSCYYSSFWWWTFINVDSSGSIKSKSKCWICSKSFVFIVNRRKLSIRLCASHNNNKLSTLLNNKQE